MSLTDTEDGRHRYAVSIRDSAGVEVAPLPEWTRLSLIDRFNAPGNWLLENVPVTATVLEHVVPGCGVVIRRDGAVIMSGPMDLPQRSWGRGVDYYALSGPDDLVHLWDRIVHPGGAPAAFPADYYVAGGPAETVIRTFVDINAGPSARSDRRVAGLTLGPVAGVGDTVTGRGRLQNLGEFVAELARAGGDIGFDIVQDPDDGGLVFACYGPEDLTDVVVFSPGAGNLRSFRYEERIAGTNYVYVGGGGEGAARVFWENSDPTSISQWGRRIESFVDQRQTTNGTELYQKSVEELAAKAGQVKLTLDVVDVEGTAFGSDYRLGDRVSVVADNASVAQIIREVAIVVDASGETVKPVLATPGGTTLGLGFAERARRLDSRLSSVERV